MQQKYVAIVVGLASVLAWQLWEAIDDTLPQTQPVANTMRLWHLYMYCDKTA